MRVPSINPRQRRAEAEGRRQDRAFFAANPGRNFHSRAALPWEFDQPSEGARIAVSQRSGGTISLSGRLGNVPDHERFLALLWAHVESMPGRAKTIPPHVHLELGKIAGLVDEGIGLP